MFLLAAGDPWAAIPATIIALTGLYVAIRNRENAKDAKNRADVAQTRAEGNEKVVEQVGKRTDDLANRTDAIAKRTGVLDELNQMLSQMAAHTVQLVTSNQEQLALSTKALVASEARNLECEKREERHLAEIGELHHEIGALKDSLIRVEKVVERIDPDLFRASGS